MWWLSGITEVLAFFGLSTRPTLVCWLSPLVLLTPGLKMAATAPSIKSQTSLFKAGGRDGPLHSPLIRKQNLPRRSPSHFPVSHVGRTVACLILSRQTAEGLSQESAAMIHMGEAGLASPGEALGLAPLFAFPGALPLIWTSFVFFPKRLINPPVISIVLPFFNLQPSTSMYFWPYLPSRPPVTHCLCSLIWRFKFPKRGICLA